jgi:hypothetical protein
MNDLQLKYIEFSRLFAETIETVWAAEDNLKYMNALAAGQKNLVDAAIVFGDETSEAITNTEKILRSEANYFNLLITHYLFMPQLKAVLILWRDILFETQKAQIKLLDSKITQAQFDKYKSIANENVTAAAESLEHYCATQRALITKNSTEKKILENWEKQDFPWEVYKKQFKSISEQSLDLNEKYNTLEVNSKGFLTIHTLIEDNITVCKQKIEEKEHLVQKVIDFIDENMELKFGKIANFVKNAELQIEHQEFQVPFSTAFQEHLKILGDRVAVPVGVEEGLISMKDVNFRRDARFWIESEILPLLYEAWEIMEYISDSLKMALVNIHNRTTLLSNEEKEGQVKSIEKDEIITPLNLFLEKTAVWTADLNKLFSLINNRIDQTFLLSSVYNLNENFLFVRLQSTINQFKFKQNKLFTQAETFFNRLTGRIQDFKTTVEQENALSTSEKVVRYIETHQTNEDNHEYSSIFLTKGYIGESFWVERKLKMQHIETIVQQWNKGFRGSIVLHGKRFSGKSLFGEMVALRYFRNSFIRLSPTGLINLEGRKFQADYNLEDALEFIKKHGGNDKYLVWIDDIELWTSTKFSISENIRTLKKYIDNHSNRIFFMVSMSNWLRAHLNKIYALDKVFQATFNLDKMDLEEMQRAIIIRHGATHQMLLNSKNESIAPNEFSKIATKICRTANGNIGEALNLWALCTEKVNEEQVKHIFKPGTSMPNFLSPDTSIVLSAIMMEKRTNEYRLRRLFGEPFNEKYRNIVQRLISVGLLKRHIDNQLEINELVVNEVGQLLADEGYLIF